jgi:hypothetical protein
MTIQCLMTAWLLWGWHTSEQGVGFWKIEETYESRADCKRDQTRTEEAMRKAGAPGLVPLQCLPDTVDPRK